MMKISEIISFLENLAPLSLQEDYDNSGLQVGDRSEEVKGILVTLDVTEEVIEEALAKKCNLIIAHHPIIFKSLKRLSGSTYIERTIRKAIQYDIAIYAIHTNLDNVLNGVNKKICERIGLDNVRILLTKPATLAKLITFIPREYVHQVLEELGKSGAGKIGNYELCSFQIEGKGTFRPNELAQPFIGSANELESVSEIKLEMIFPTYARSQIIQALRKTHPYEEVAYDIVPLLNQHPELGSGMIGTLEQPLPQESFLALIKNKFDLEVIRYSGKMEKNIQTVAVCGGSGSFLLKTAMAQNADAFITADIKYHDFFDAQNRILFADIGHYESEIFTKELLKEHISEKFPNIALHLAEVVTNPVNYFY